MKYKNFIKDIWGSLLMVVGFTLILFLTFNAISLLHSYSNTATATVLGDFDNCVCYKATSGINCDILSLLKCLKSTDINIMIEFSGTTSGSSSTNSMYSVVAYNQPVNRQLHRGSYPADGFSDKCILAGDYYSQDFFIKNGKEYIAVNGIEYPISGIFANASESCDDTSIAIFYPDSCFNNDSAYSELAANVTDTNVKIIFCGNSASFKSEVDAIINNIRNNTDYTVAKDDIKSYQVINLILSKLRQVINLIVILFSLINCLAIVNMWIKKRKQELSIRKTFGYTNVRLMCMIILDIIKLMFVSFILALILQTVYSLIWSYSFNLSYIFEYIIWSIFVSAIIIFISVTAHIGVLIYTTPAKGVSSK